MDFQDAGGEPVWRGAAFVFVLVTMATAEAMWPRRERRHARRTRWTANLSMAAVDTVLVRLIAPAGLAGFAMYVEDRGWGVLPALTDSAPARALVAFLALDLLVYAQHVAFHHVPALWRVHRVHHIDEDFDTTTGVRFHPFEIVVSLGIKAAAVAALGAPVGAVLAFEVALNATSLFNHANLRLSGSFDRVLRALLVTPDMHRVHHSIRREEQDANFGFNLPWWDRLFRTYRGHPAEPHDVMPIGVAGEADPGRLFALLRLPLTGPRGAAADAAHQTVQDGTRPRL